MYAAQSVVQMEEADVTVRKKRFSEHFEYPDSLQAANTEDKCKLITELLCAGTREALLSCSTAVIRWACST